jgi:type II secretion system protein G
MTVKGHVQQKGFTIVELLIVIVVIGILAAIVIVAYQGVTARANDTSRIDSITKIRKGLELYKTINGTYPTATNSGTSSANGYPGGGWEVSSIQGSTWLNKLLPYIQPIPTDPRNDSTYFFYYYFYINNTGMCGVVAPNCYVLGVSKLDTLNGLDQAGVDTSGTDTWRNSSATRPVWRGAF